MSSDSPLIIPCSRLTECALRNVIAEYVTRDGTELSDAEGKIEQVRRQLESGKAVIVYDAGSGSCNIVPAQPAR